MHMKYMDPYIFLEVFAVVNRSKCVTKTTFLWLGLPGRTSVQDSVLEVFFEVFSGRKGFKQCKAATGRARALMAGPFTYCHTVEGPRVHASSTNEAGRGTQK